MLKIMFKNIFVVILLFLFIKNNAYSSGKILKNQTTNLMKKSKQIVLVNNTNEKEQDNLTTQKNNTIETEQKETEQKIIETNVAETVQVLEVPEVETKIKTSQSLMFQQEDMVEVFNALSRFKEYKGSVAIGNDDIFLRQKFDDSNFYYLNSIMYISKNKWSVWINGKKLTNEKPENNNLKVINVSPSSVSFSLDESLEKWQFITSKNKVPQDNYNLKENKVILYFTLYTNQSFMPVSYKIVEGKPIQNIQKEINNDEANAK